MGDSKSGVADLLMQITRLPYFDNSGAPNLAHGYQRFKHIHRSNPIMH